MHEELKKLYSELHLTKRNQGMPSFEAILMCIDNSSDRNKEEKIEDYLLSFVYLFL